MGWEIVESLKVDGNKIRWYFPPDLKAAIQDIIDVNPFVIYINISNTCLSDYDQIAPFPFWNNKGSSGSWQGQGNTYTIGQGTMSISDSNTGYYWNFDDKRIGCSGILNDNGTVCPFFIINHDIQKVCMVSIHSAWRLPGDRNRIIYHCGNQDNPNLITAYQYFISAIPTSYIWTPVEKIEGNGNIYLLTTIDNINEGEPVNNGDRDDVSLSSGSSLKALIGDIIVDNSNVVVKYTIPEDDYEYIKLVYKKGDSPDSITDGTAVDITQSSTSQIITDVAETSGTWWFTIFTNKTVSNSVSFKGTLEYESDWRFININLYQSSVIADSIKNKILDQVYDNGTTGVRSTTTEFDGQVITPIVLERFYGDFDNFSFMVNTLEPYGEIEQYAGIYNYIDHLNQNFGGFIWDQYGFIIAVDEAGERAMFCRIYNNVKVSGSSQRVSFIDVIYKATVDSDPDFYNSVINSEV